MSYSEYPCPDGYPKPGLWANFVKAAKSNDDLPDLFTDQDVEGFFWIVVGEALAVSSSCRNNTLVSSLAVLHEYRPVLAVRTAREVLELTKHISV